jgi:hypothetical protein
VLEHVAWSRGITRGKVDETSKTICFEYPADLNGFFLLTQAISEEWHTDSQLREVPFEALREGFTSWVKRSTTEFIGAQTIRGSEVSAAYSRIALVWLEKALWPELSGSIDLQGYTLDEFRHFYAALFVYSQYCAWAEDHMDMRYGSDNDAGSIVISGLQPEIVSWLAEMSGVKRDSLASIIEDLTFDADDFYSTIMTRPFVQLANGSIYLLARVFSMLDPMRVLADVLILQRKVANSDHNSDQNIGQNGP